MYGSRTLRSKIDLGACLLGVLLLPVMLGGTRAQSGAVPSEPWSDTQLLSPENLAGRLTDAKGAKPGIIYVGFRRLYVAGHIPGSRYYGPASTPGGLAELKKQVKSLPRDREVILYCGCCPWKQCPNIRPAFRALHEMGFTRLGVLNLPTSLVQDWVRKGFPVQKGN